jgi:small redox-active disulfide protein 2
MEIKIYGTGCKKCNKLYSNTQEAIRQLNIEAEIFKVEDMGEIVAAGVINTPALMVDNVVKVAGRVPAVKDIVKLLA